MVLAERWPSSIAFEDLLRAAVAKMVAAKQPQPDDATLEAHRQRLSIDLLQMYSAALIELRVRPLRLCLLPGDKPVASEVARAQLNRPGPVTNLRHEAVGLDPFLLQLLRLLDGTRDRQALIEGLLVAVRQGALEAKQNGTPVTDDTELRKLLGEALNTSLPKLAGLGLLVA